MLRFEDDRKKNKLFNVFDVVFSFEFLSLMLIVLIRLVLRRRIWPLIRFQILKLLG